MISPDEPDIAPGDNEGCLEDCYSPDDCDDQYPFSDDRMSIIGSRAVRVIPLEAGDTVNAHITRASKPDISKPQVIESNHA